MRNAFSLPLPFDNPLAKAVVMRQPEPALFSDHYYCTSSFCLAKRAGMLFVLRVSVTWKVVFVLLGYPHFQVIGEVAWQQLCLQTSMYFHCRKVGSSNQIFECHYTCTWQQDKSESKDVGFIFSRSLDCTIMDGCSPWWFFAQSTSAWLLLYIELATNSCFYKQDSLALISQKYHICWFDLHYLEQLPWQYSHVPYQKLLCIDSWK